MKTILKSIKKLFGMSNLSNPKLWATIESSPLITQGDYYFIARLRSKNNWTLAKAENSIEAYKKFLYLAAISNEVSPSPDVDIVWHEHILFTQDYFERWSKILGKTIHHHPEIKGLGKSYDKTYQSTGNKFREEFGASNNSLDYFPVFPIITTCETSSGSSSIITELGGGMFGGAGASESWSSNDSPSSNHSSHSCSSHSDTSSHSSCSSSSCSSSSCGSSCGGGGD